MPGGSWDLQAWLPDIEGYSAFEGYVTDAVNPADPPKEDKGELAPRDTEMAQLLRDNGIDRVVVVGLATDFWHVSPHGAGLVSG